MSDAIIVGLCDGRVVNRGEELVTYALGSCIGICLYDSQKCIAGMVHIMLPHKENALARDNDYKFADAGIAKLNIEMIRKGADKKRITAKIVGGAEMFRLEGSGMRIGERNSIAVKVALQKMGIPLIAEDTGGDFGRSIWLESLTGIVRVKAVKKGMYII